MQASEHEMRSVTMMHLMDAYFWTLEGSIKNGSDELHSKSPHTKTYDSEMSLFMTLCDEIVEDNQDAGS